MGKTTLKVLVVEDEGLTSTDLERVVRKGGFEPVAIAASSEQALDLFKEHMPDIVLMDIRLEGDVDGIATAKKILKIKDVPVIFITANSDPGLMDRAVLNNPYGYILKPFRDHEIITAVRLAARRAEFISELKRKDEEIVALKDFYQGVLDSLHDLVTVIDENYNVIYHNRALEHTLSKPVGKGKCYEIFHGRETSCGDCYLTPVFSGSCAEYRKVVKFARPDGNVKHLDLRITLLSAENSPVKQAVVSGRDITPLVEAKEASEKMQMVFLYLLQASPMGIVITDQAGRVSFVNATMLKMTGYIEDDLKGKDIQGWINPKVKHIFENAAAADHDCTAEMEISIRKADGTEMHSSLVVSCFSEPVKPEYRIVFFISDRSFEKKLETKQVMLQNHIEAIMGELDSLNEMLLETGVYSETIKGGKAEFDSVERRILRYVEQGQGTVQMAKNLKLAEITVKKRLSKIYAKLGINNRYQLIEYIHTNYIPSD
jgi:PAS domain S-box-containing protein